MEEIENIELSFLSYGDYQELKQAMIESYTSMPYDYWQKHEIKRLLNLFPELSRLMAEDGMDILFVPSLPIRKAGTPGFITVHRQGP